MVSNILSLTELLLINHRKRIVHTGEGGCLVLATNYGFGYSNDNGCGGYGNGDGYGRTEGVTTGIAMTRAEEIASRGTTATTTTVKP